MGRTTICSSGWDSPPLATCFLWALLEESKQRKGFVAVFGWLAVFFSGDKPGFGPAAELLSLALLEESKQRKGFVAVFGWLAVSRSGDKPGFGPAAELLSFASPKESNQRKGFVAVFGWLAVSRSGDKPGFGPAAELLSFASPKESNQRKGEPRPCRFAVPCATRSVRIKALALFERSEFASVPNAASSARNPKGTDVARLFFGYFFLAKQKKVTRPPGRDPASSRSETQSAQQKTKKNLSLPTSPQQRQ